MHDGKAVTLAILMADAFGCPTADGIDDVCWTSDSQKTIPQTVPEGVDDTSIRHSRLQPFVQCHEFTVNVDQGISRYRQPLLLCLVILDEGAAEDSGHGQIMFPDGKGDHGPHRQEDTLQG